MTDPQTTDETIVEKREKSVRDLLIRHGFGRLSFDQGIKEIDKILSKIHHFPDSMNKMDGG